MPAGVRCALIPTAFGLRETHERERRQDRGVARVAPNPRVPRAGAAPSSISGRNTTRRPLRAPVSRRCSRRYPLPGRARAVRREASRGARARREREPRTRPRPNLAFCAAAPSSISGGTATRGSPRAREAPPIPAGERLRLAADVAPTCTIEPFATRGARAVAIEEPRARARRPRVSRQRSVCDLRC